MKRVAIASLAAAFAALSAGGAGAQPFLKDSVVVDGDAIRLGDLFSGLEEKAEVAVAPAPALGRRGIYDAQWLSRVARSHDLAWRPRTRFDRVVVERASQTLGAADVAAAAETALMRHYAEQGTGRDVQVELDNRTIELHAAPGARPRLEMRDLSVDERAQRFHGTLAVSAGDGRPQLHKVSGRVFEVMEIPVLNRRVRRGEVVGAGDIVWIEARREAIDRNIATDPAQIVGKTPRRTAPAERPLRANDFHDPVVVEKGALVTVVLERPGMVLTAQGRAEEDGAEGAVIQVLNTHSRNVIDAVVEGPSRVRVGSASAAARRTR